MKVYATFEALQASVQTLAGSEFVVRDRANANYILKPAGYTALAGDATFANSRVAALQLELSNLKLEQFGAKGDGVTDDTAAIVAAISRGDATRGARINLEPKRYEYSSFTVDRPIRFTGVNDITQLRTSLTTGTKILITTPRQCIFESIIFSGASTQVSGEVVRINSGAVQNLRTHISNCVFAACHDAIVTETCVSLRLTNNYFASYQRRALTIENTIINDAGNHVLIGNTFDAGAQAAAVGIYQKNSGGLRCLGNKWLAGAYHYLAEIIETGTSPLATSIVMFNGNSFENCTTAAIQFNAVSPFVFKYIQVTGNQFSLSGAKGVSITPAAYQHVIGFSIIGNSFKLAQNGPTSIDLASCASGLIGENHHTGVGATESAILIAADCSDITIGAQQIDNVPTKYTVNASATNIKFSGALYESGTESTTTSNVYGALPLYASPGVAVTFAESFPAVPKLNLIPITSGGVLSVAATNITATGFTAIVYGISNNGSVSFNWEARL